MLIRWYCILCLFLSSFHPVATIAQCDRQVIASENPTLSYRDRGNRCEGFFRSKVATSGLEIVGFTLGEFRFLKDDREEISVTLPFHTTERVHIRAVGIPNGLYYRMDAELTGKEILTWEIKEVLMKHIQTAYWKNLGLLGFIEKAGEKTFLPVVTSTKLIDQDKRGPPRLILRSPTKVQQILWRLAEEDEYTKLPNSYKAGKPIIIKLPDQLRGEITLEVRARTSSASNWLTRTYKIKI